MKNKGITLIIAIAAMFVVAACSDEEALLDTGESKMEAVPVLETTSESISSITISGVYTDVVGAVDCTTCTYTVADNATVVDGEASKLKPGSIICLGKGRQVGEVEFLNMIGTEDEPIIIGNCDE